MTRPGTQPRSRAERLREPRELARRRRRDVATIVAVYALFGGAALSFHHSALPPVRSQFYEIAAQIIPVLLLVVAIERRVLEMRPSVDRSPNSIRLCIAAAFLLGEGSALYVVAIGHDESWLFAAVVVNLLIGFLLVFAVGVSGLMPRSEHTARAADDVRAIVGASAGDSGAGSPAARG
jgi:hypothetical protein